MLWRDDWEHVAPLGLGRLKESAFRGLAPPAMNKMPLPGQSKFSSFKPLKSTGHF